MMRLNQFQAFVHEGRGVDVDLRPHRPGWVGAGLGRSRAGHALARCGPERPAGGGQRHRDHVLRPAGAKRLLQRVVLRIDRQDAGPKRFRIAHEGFAGTDEALLVGERDGAAGFERGVRRQKAGRAADRRHDDVGRPVHRLEDGGSPGPGPDPRPGKRVPQRIAARPVGERGKARADLARDPGERLSVAAADDGCDPEAVAVRGEDVDGRTADRARRAKDGDGRHPAHPWRSCTPASTRPIRAAAAQNPSRRSITPPWPGMRTPESFAPKRRFKADSPRSPSWLSTDATAERSTTIAKLTGAATPNLPATSTTMPPAATPATSPPKNPDQVFLGLTRGHSFGPPKRRPAK